MSTYNKNRIQHPKISVIMPVRNGADYVAKAIESIRSQTFTDWELIIIDDSSTELTQAIIRPYLELDRRIKLIENERQMGIANSLNRGIQLAQGEYIARADADDINLSARFEKQYEFMQSNHEIDVLGTGAWLLNSNNERVKPISLPETHEELALCSFKKTCFFHSSVLIRHRFFMKVGLYDSNFIRAQDKELWLRGLAMGSRYANLSEPLIEYRTNNYIRSWNSIYFVAIAIWKIGHIYKVKDYWLYSLLSFLSLSLIKLNLYKPKALRRKI